MGGHLLQEGTSSGAGPSVSSRGIKAAAEPSSATPNASGSVPTKIVVYQNVLSFLKDACNTWIPGRSRSEVARIQTTVEGYLLSMASDNVVSAIVASPGHRKILLELSSILDLETDPRLRTALRADEEGIAAFIVSILDSKSAQEGVLSLEGDSAQCFIDVVQDALNRGFLMGQDHSRQARRIVRKLSESCDKLPSSLFITGVTGREEHPTFAGGFGDIYRASHGTKIVALKHMRHFIQSSDPEIRDIRLKLCREALVWKDLSHPHILPFLGIDRDSFPSALCAVSPWMEHGTILKYLQGHGRGNVDKLLHEVAQGLQYLHSRNIVHGDLRGANILINEDWSACLADFGLSVFANATTSMYTSTRAGSLHWMAPELIDPERFGYKFARTKASDIYAFGCVCLELYTGQPPFSELSQTAALLRVVDGERPGRPSGPPAMSDALWQHVNRYWAEDPTTRPVAEVIVQEMGQLSPRKPRQLRALPPIPVPRSAPLASPSEPASTPSSPPVYVSPQGSPPGYDHGDYQRVELTPFKLAQMEKARQQGPSRELDLRYIMKLVGKASGRTLLDQTVVLTDGVQTLFERARQREVTKRDAFVKQLAEYSDARRFHSQDAVFHRRAGSPESMDPDEIITLPQFVKEGPPPHVLDDPLPVTPPPKTPVRPRRPSLPWLRISPSLTSLRYRLTNPKSTPSIALPGSSNTGGTVVSGGPKTSSPLHRRFRSASKKRLSGSSGPDSPVRERVRDVFSSSSSASGSKTDVALQGLCQRAKPAVIDTEDARSNSPFSVGHPSEHDLDDIPASPLKATIDEPHTTPDEVEATTKESEVVTKESEAAPVIDLQLPDKGRNPNTPHHIPPDEDMWRLFECRYGTGNAAQLGEALAMTPPEGILKNSVIEELHKTCVESQEVISTQIPWASASAERSRVVKDKDQSGNSVDGDEALEPPMLTWEEELLLEMLAANEGLLSALRLYDDLMRVAVKREAEQRHVDTPRRGGSSRQRPQAVVSDRSPPKGPPPPVPQTLDVGQPVDEDSQPSPRFKVKALKPFTADPDDPDEISFNADDILDVLDKQGKWWLVQSADGSVGIASSDYFSVVDDDRQAERAEPLHPYGSSGNEGSFSQEEIFDVVDEQLQWWKARKSHGSISVLSSDLSSVSGSEPETFQYKAQALYSYTADTEDHRELSFRQGETLDIGDKQGDWWQARNANGSIGIAPSNYLCLL